MRLTSVPVLCLGVTVAGAAVAQNLAYTVRTAETVRQSGSIVASGHKWQCGGQACSVSGSRAVLSISACAALAQKVGRITAYGHTSAKLSAKQLERCNRGVPASSPQLRSQIRQEIAARPPLPGPKTAPATKPAAQGSAGAAATAALAIEEVGYQDYTLYVRPRQGMAYHGTYAGAYPPRGAALPVVAWSGSVLRLPGLSHRGTDDRNEVVLPSGSVPADRVVSISPSGRFVEVPLNFEELPQRVAQVQIECTFSAIAANTGVYDGGAFNEANKIGFALAIFWRRAISEGDWRLGTTARLPVNLRHFMVPADIKSTHCGVRLFVSRTNSSGVDQVLIGRAADPSHASFVPGMAAAPGSAPVHEFIVNVGGEP